MATRIVVAGATGNLGQRITKALVGKGVHVVALARKGASDEKLKSLKSLGAEVAVVDMTNAAEIAKSCAGAASVVSAVSGLRDVIVGTQSILLEAALAAGVPRFIPSDFSTDFTNLTLGENRNFDLRREFHKRLDVASISSTAIFNGAFGELLKYNIPVLNFKEKQVGYWEDADLLMDFTTMDDTAAFTATAALDPKPPRVLKIASFQVSPRQLAMFTDETLKTPFELKRLGSLEELREHNKRERAAHPEGENQVNSSWQQSQYIQSMFSTHHESLDNDRYPGLRWTKLADLISPGF